MAIQRLRTAVVGLGRIGWQFHAPEIVAHPEFELVAVVDLLDARLREAHAAWGVRGYTSLEAMLAEVHPDLVVIASPTPFHLEQTLAAFRAGADVFCDKPLAPSLAEVDRMVEGMRTHGRKLMVYQPHRAGREITGLRQLLAENLVGDVFMIKRACSNFSRRNDWQALKQHGGGMLNNYGAHYVDQLLSLAGSPARRLTCALRAVVTLGDAEDMVKLVIETASGMLLDLDINMAAALPMPPWQVFGTRGTLSLDETAKLWRVRDVTAAALPPLALQQGLAAEARRYGSGETIPWQERTLPLAEVEPIDFYRRCYEYYALNAAPFVPIAETREVMRVLAVARSDAGWSEAPTP